MIAKNAFYSMILLGLYSCHSTSKPAISSKNIFPLFNDSLYRYRNLTGVITDTSFHNDGLIELDSFYKSLTLDNLPPINHSTIGYNAYFISKQNPTDKFQAILLKQGGDDYGSVQMIMIDKNTGAIIDSKEIAGGLLDGPDETDTSVILPSNRYSKIIDAQHLDYFQIKEIVPIKDSAITNTARFYDSISYKIYINDAGKFETTYIDSVHFFRTITPPQQP